MNALVVVISLLVIASIAAVLVFRPSKAGAVGLIVVCLGVAAFSLFGFLASFEPSVNGTNLGFKIVYAGMFLAALVGVFRSGRRLFSSEA